MKQQYNIQLASFIFFCLKNFMTTMTVTEQQWIRNILSIYVMTLCQNTHTVILHQSVLHAFCAIFLLFSFLFFSFFVYFFCVLHQKIKMISHRFMTFYACTSPAPRPWKHIYLSITLNFYFVFFSSFFFCYFDASCLHAWPKLLRLIWLVFFYAVLSFKMIDFPGHMEIFLHYIHYIYTIEGKLQSLKLIQTQEKTYIISNILIALIRLK